MLAEIQKLDFPADFTYDTVVSGGLFSKEKTDALVLSNPGHRKDYFTFVFYFETKKIGSILNIALTGNSKHLGKAYIREAMKEDRKGWDLNASVGQNLGYKLGSSIGGAIRSIGTSKKKAAEEQEYYDAINYVIGKVLQ